MVPLDIYTGQLAGRQHRLLLKKGETDRKIGGISYGYQGVGNTEPKIPPLVVSSPSPSIEVGNSKMNTDGLTDYNAVTKIAKNINENIGSSRVTTPPAGWEAESGGNSNTGNGDSDSRQNSISRPSKLTPLSVMKKKKYLGQATVLQADLNDGNEVGGEGVGVMMSGNGRGKNYDKNSGGGAVEEDIEFDESLVDGTIESLIRPGDGDGRSGLGRREERGGDSGGGRDERGGKSNMRRTDDTEEDDIGYYDASEGYGGSTGSSAYFTSIIDQIESAKNNAALLDIWHSLQKGLEYKNRMRDENISGPRPIALNPFLANKLMSSALKLESPELAIDIFEDSFGFYYLPDPAKEIITLFEEG